MRKVILLAITVFTISIVSAQDFSNKGKDFWLCFPQHVPNTSNSFAVLSIFITSDRASSGTITMPNGAFSATFNIAANGLQEIQIPWNASIHISNTESSNEGVTQILKKSIRIKVDPGQPAVVAYAQQWAGARSAATLLLPVNVLGRKYYAISFNQLGTGGQGYNARSQFQIIATKPNTVVEITPVKNGVKQAKFTVNLPQEGDMIQYQSPDAAAASQDLTGTYIESVASGSNGCLPIAVYSGSSNITFGTAIPNCNGGSYDPLWQQLYPATTWGKNFGFVPFADYVRGDPYRVMASEDNTNVYFNGAFVATLNAGQIYPAAFTPNPQVLTAPTNISADKPICVAQYAQADACTGYTGNPRVGDPDMVILNPIEQNISDITIFSSTRQNISRQWVNVLIQNTGIPTFRISKNGGPLNPPAASWQPFAALPGYSYIQESLIGVNSARLVSDSGFNAIAYGWGNVESYAYSAGTNVRDLYQQIGVSTEYGNEPTPSVCTNSPFRFKVSLPYCADSIRWDLSFLPGPPSPPIDTIRYNTCVPGVGGPDSTTIVNGKTLYWYSLPSLYSFSTIGTYPVSMITYAPNTSGCGSEQLIDFDLQISDPPVPSFTYTPAGCVAEPYQFTETTAQTPKPTYRWYWDFGDGITSTGVRNPQHTYALPGTYTVRYASITTPGCLSDTIQQTITVAPLPSATISGTGTTVCMNTLPEPAITFTGTGGTPPYTFTYTINGISQPTINSPGVSSSVTILAPTNIAGPFVYNLAKVQNAGSSLCIQNISGQSVTVTINPLPATAVAGGTTVCLNSAAPPVTFTGSGATAPYTFAYSLNGIPQTPVVSNAAGVYILNAPTNIAGAFTYAITMVTDASSTLCSAASNVSTTITVNDLPNASISGATAVCLNAAQPPVTFTGSGGTAPYTFSYTVNGVTQAPLVSNAAGIGIINAPTNVAGTFTYALVSVQEGSSITCFHGGLTGTTIITVNPLPAAAIAGGTTVCLNSAPPPPVTFTGSGSTAPYTFAYSINGIPQTPVVSNAAGIYTINASTNVAGSFTYTITSVTDASSTLCSSAPNVSTTIIVNDLPNASISGGIAVCLNSAPPPVTFTGSGGTAPYTFNYTINSIAQPPLISNAAGVGTINAPTNVVGPFTYALVSVQEGSPLACLRNGLAGTTLITVNPLPSASINGTTEVCLNAPSPFITFTGSGSTAPYIFNYTINGVPQPALPSNALGIATIAVPTGVANTFTYSLTSVTDGSSTACSQVIAGQQAVVTVNPLPTANFSNSAPSCETRTINFTDLSVANAGTLNSWSWVFGDPGSGANTSTAQNPSHTFATAGTYIVTLTVTTDKGCTSNPAASIPVTINLRPASGFTIPDVCINDIAAVFTDTSKIAVPGAIDPSGYVWDFGDGSPRTFTKDGTHLYLATGVYQVMHVVTSSFGCKDTIVQSITINGANPVANFSVSNPATLCANDSVAITNLSTVNFGNVTRIEIYWDNVGFPLVVQTDNSPAPNKVYRHLYPNFQSPLTKTFNIRYRAFSGTLCVDEITRTITVNAAPLVQFNAMPDACLLAIPFQITQASEVGGVPGTGVFTGPGVSLTGIFTPLIAGIGTHTIKYTFTSSAAGCVDTMSNTITVLDTASAKFSYVSPLCQGNPATFTEESTTPGTVTLSNTTWNFGDGSPLENHLPGTVFTHIFPGTGTYNVSMFNTSSIGCRSTPHILPVTVSPAPVPNFAVDKPAYCIPNAIVQFNNSSTVSDGSGMTYSWDFGDGSPLNSGVNPQHWYPSVGPYFVKLVVTSGIGCFHDTTILVNNIHPQPKADFTFNKPGICIGDNVTITDNSDGKDGVINQWNWDLGDGSTRNTSSFNYTYIDTNTFNITLYSINSYGCNSDTVSKAFTVYPYPKVDAGPDRYILEGGTITLESVTYGNDLQFLWTPDLYLVDNKVAKVKVNKPLTDMTYRLTVSARGGCTLSDDVFVKLLRFPVIPNTFTPNNDGINDTWRIDYLNTYPNNRVQIFTRNGNLVFESRGYSTPWDGTYKGKPLPFDTYYYIIEPGNGRDPITGYVTIIK